MQVDLSTVLSIIATLASLGLGAWLATARYAVAQRDKEIDRRLDECRVETRSIHERLHAEEKSTIRQDGEIARSRDTHANLYADIEEIKRTMVTKSEMQSLERSIGQILSELQRKSSGAFQGPRREEYRFPESPPPPKKDPR